MTSDKICSGNDGQFIFQTRCIQIKLIHQRLYVLIWWSYMGAENLPRFFPKFDALLTSFTYFPHLILLYACRMF